jgi:hypothetical protein
MVWLNPKTHTFSFPKPKKQWQKNANWKFRVQKSSLIELFCWVSAEQRGADDGSETVDLVVTQNLICQ